MKKNKRNPRTTIKEVARGHVVVYTSSDIEQFTVADTGKPELILDKNGIPRRCGKYPYLEYLTATPETLLETVKTEHNRYLRIARQYNL